MKITLDVPSQTDAQVDGKKQPKLVDAAQQFEAMMLQEMLKPMRGEEGEDSWGGEESGDNASDTIKNFGSEAFAKAISKGGGFGIAKQVVSQVNMEHQKHSEKKTVKY